MKVELDQSNYTTKCHLREATDIDKSKFNKKNDLATLKVKADKINVDKLKVVPTDLSYLMQ